MLKSLYPKRFLNRSLIQARYDKWPKIRNRRYMRFRINDNLINYSAQVLAHTEDGMTWAQIAKFFRRKSAEYNVAAPYVNTLFPSNLANRRDGFIRNLRVFSPEQQFILTKWIVRPHQQKGQQHAAEEIATASPYKKQIYLCGNQSWLNVTFFNTIVYARRNDVPPVKRDYLEILVQPIR